MAETELKKKLARKPSDEIDPETGLPYEDIPGVEYPAEMEVVESALMSKPGVPMLKSAAKAVGRQVGRDFENKAIENYTKVPLPTREQMWDRAIRDPKFHAEMTRDFSAAQNLMHQENVAAAKNYAQQQSTMKYSKSPTGGEGILSKMKDKMPE